MNDSSAVQLHREVQAVRIPIGETVTLAAGTPVDITQTLGGSYTVRSDGGLFRIAAVDADALGLSADVSSAPASGRPADEQAIWDVLKTCFDPEIPVNIVDLGLVYDVHMDAMASGNKQVGVKMTLTAPGCGMGEVIARDAQMKLLDLPGIEEATVEIVWDPPWHQSMITEEGRRVLGLA